MDTYATADSTVLLSRPVKVITSLLYYNLCNDMNVYVVQWLWPWMSDIRFDGSLSLFVRPSFVAGVALCVFGAFLLQDAKRLKIWMREVKELLAKESMRASLNPNSNHQSVGNVKAGQSVSITQEIVNHYNHPPDKPKATLLVAVIGAIATIIAAWLGTRGH